jgi:hypothetical protein
MKKSQLQLRTCRYVQLHMYNVHLPFTIAMKQSQLQSRTCRYVQLHMYVQCTFTFYNCNETITIIIKNMYIGMYNYICMYNGWPQRGHLGWVSGRSRREKKNNSTWKQGCQIFLGAWYQNRKNVPNEHKILKNGNKLSKISVKY